MTISNKKFFLLLVVFGLISISPQTDRNVEKIDSVKSIELLNQEAELLEVQLKEVVNSLERLNN